MTDEPREPSVIDAAVPAPQKTPFFQAVHAARYQRQAIIKNIEATIGNHFICYVAGTNTLIDRGDIVGLVDILHNIPQDEPLDLMLHTVGGDIDAAEKFASLLRTRSGQAQLRVIVPDFAKSAGTLIALGADVIVMSDASELGPIDPQVVLTDGHGNFIPYSVVSYLNAYAQHRAALLKDPANVVAQLMLNKLDPVTIKQFEAVRDRSRKIAENHLRFGMFKDGGNWSQAASELIDVNQYLSHGQMISWEDASGTRLGLRVDYMPPASTSWQQYWQLYCLQRLAIRKDQKIFESNYASLILDND